MHRLGHLKVVRHVLLGRADQDSVAQVHDVAHTLQAGGGGAEGGGGRDGSACVCVSSANQHIMAQVQVQCGAHAAWMVGRGDA